MLPAWFPTIDPRKHTEFADAHKRNAAVNNSDRCEMQISASGLDLIKKFEGFSSHVYRDVAGNLTIGYGHKLLQKDNYPKGITEAEASCILGKDVSAAEYAVARLVKVPLVQGQFDALVDFVFNLGETRLAESTLLKSLNAGKYAFASQQLLLWDHADGRVIADLKARRQAEFNLWHQ